MIHPFCVLLMFTFWPSFLLAEVLKARYIEPTDVYGHGAVAGGEYAALEITSDAGIQILRFKNAVSEDTAPRVADLDQNGTPEIIAVAADLDKGAYIAILTEEKGRFELVLTTPPIGMRHRWLAIVGVADLDGDGLQEIVYVDRPHLAKILVVLRIHKDGPRWSQERVTQKQGLTNHHYRSAVMERGIRICDGRAEIVTADANWQNIVLTKLQGRVLKSRKAGFYDGPASLTDQLGC